MGPLKGESKYEFVKKSLLWYQRLHGDMLVTITRRCNYHNGDVTITRSFVVPETANWPESIRGIKLGKIVNHIRSRNSFKDHREELEAMGIEYPK
jgi:hypothetical protein